MTEQIYRVTRRVTPQTDSKIVEEIVEYVADEIREQDFKDRIAKNTTITVIITVLQDETTGELETVEFVIPGPITAILNIESDGRTTSVQATGPGDFIEPVDPGFIINDSVAWSMSTAYVGGSRSEGA